MLQEFEKRGFSINEGIAVDARLVKSASRPLSNNELKKLTGAKVAINHREKDWVEQALKPLPPGINL